MCMYSENDVGNVVKRSHVITIGEGYMGIILLYLQLFCVSEIISKHKF